MMNAKNVLTGLPPTTASTQLSPRQVSTSLEARFPAMRGKREIHRAQQAAMHRKHAILRRTSGPTS